MKMKKMIYKKEYECELLFKGVYKGLDFYIISCGLYPCAYVENPIDDLYDYDDRRIIDISVNGGFTYFDTLPEDNTKKFLGWDYAHSNDYIGDGTTYNFCDKWNKKQWTTQEIFEEVKHAIDKLLLLK